MDGGTQVESDEGIPDDVVDGMVIEFEGAVDEATELGMHFHAALDSYRLHRHDRDEPALRRALAEFYVQAVCEDPLDPSRVLSPIHWRAIKRCAAGQAYAEEERKESPFEVLKIHTRQLRVYVSDAAQCWYLFKLFVQRDGSFHRINFAERLAFGGEFHYSFHPSGVVHDTNPSGHKRYAALYWRNFRELDISPMGGIGLSPEGLQDPLLDSLRCLQAPQAGLTFDIPRDARMFHLEMWLGKADRLRDPEMLRERMVPVLSDRIEKITTFPMATFLDPTDGYTFDIDVAIALIVRADELDSGAGTES